MANTRRARVVPLLLVLAVAACGDDDGGGEADQASATTTAMTTLPAATDVPIDPDFVEFLVNADDTSAYGHVEAVPLGHTVILALVSDTDREYHVHGYDLVGEAAAGTERVFEFTADQAGTFDVEDHVSGDVILVLEVG
jgi:hypothetical protein